jgi:endonuclease/exonuclease/phosphatase family metal-dependent hydrolase
VPVHWRDTEIHVVVVHLGLIHASRVRQAERLAQLVAQQIPPQAKVVVAGDFNDWNEKLDGILESVGLQRAALPDAARVPTYPSLIPVLALDRVYTRGLTCQSMMVPKGGTWARLSDHLPLVVELDLST